MSRQITKVDKEVKENFEHTFNILESGLYIVEIIASAKSWWQNLKEWRTFFNDDDLAVKINGIEFLKLNGKGGLFDGEAAWNGNNLKGLKKTGIFVLNLKAGDNKIEFIADKRPYLESIKIEKVSCGLESPDTGNVSIEYVPSDENKQAQDGNNRQWINVVFADLPIKEIAITAKAEKREKDNDDIKLIIDGEIQKNKDSEYFKNWYWAGSLDDAAKAADTEKFGWKEFKKEVNLPKGLHYIELWADRMPSLNNIKVTFLDEEAPDKKQQITAKVVWEITKFRSDPKLDEQNILGELKQGDEVEIIERAVAGERPTNKKGEFLTSDRWHKVKLNNKEGYIFSMTLEIVGEEQEAIQDFIIQKSKELEEDECLMLAIAKRESKFFPYCVSDMGANGLFQIVADAMSHVNDEFEKNFSDPFDIYQNIEAGILYWKIIQKKYKNCDEFLSRCLAAWNRGLNKVSNTKPFILAEQPIETRQFIKDVKVFWQENKDNIKNQGKILLFCLLAIAGVISFTISVCLFLCKFNKATFQIPQCYSNFSAIDEKIIDIDQDGKKEKLILINDVPNSTFNIIKLLLIRKDNSFIELPNEGSELQWWKTGDFNQNGKIEVAISYGYTGSAGFGDFYLYEWNRNNFITLFSREEIGSKVSFKDIDKDGTEEMLYEFYPLKWSKKQLDIYKWDDEKLTYNAIRVNIEEESNAL